MLADRSVEFTGLRHGQSFPDEIGHVAGLRSTESMTESIAWRVEGARIQRAISHVFVPTELQ
jgi:hypothetical protein